MIKKTTLILGGLFIFIKLALFLKNKKMNILVYISCVPDTTSKISFSVDNKYLDKSNIQWIINPLDEYVLSKAILLQREIGAKISVITVGTIETENILRKTLAMGVDEAIRIDTPAESSLNVAQEIVHWIKENHFDLILTGKESIDFQSSTTPSLIAQLLNLPFLNSCIHLEINHQEIIAKRETPTDVETIKTKLPLVIAGQKGIVNEKEIIIPNIRGMINAKNKPILVIAAKENNAEIETYFEKSPERGQIKFISPDNLDELIRILHEEEKLI